MQYKDSKMQRRPLLKALLSGGLFSPWLSTHAQSSWPSKPIKIIMGYGAGGAGDVSWRIAAEKLSERLGVQGLVENRPSAGAIVAGQAVKQAAPDGYTFLHAASGNFAMTPSLFKSLPFDTQTDFDMVSELTRHSMAVIALSNSPYKRLEDVIAAAKANPGKIFLGITAIGTGQHLTAELFKSVAGIDVQLVPFKNSPDLLMALRSGSIQLSIDTLAPVMGQIKGGALKAIALTDPQRFPGLPDVPTFAESGLMGFEVFTAWNGIAAPAHTPKAVIDRMAKEIAEVVALPEVKAKFLEFGMVAVSTTPAQSKNNLAKDISAWRILMERSKIEKQ